MTAVGSLHESLKQHTWTQSAPSLHTCEVQFASQQWNKAVGLLVGANADAPRCGLMLTCILFFMAFDLMQNKVDSSICHLQHAWSILSAYRSEENISTTTSEADLIEDHLLPIIARFSESWSPGTAASASIVTKDVKQRAQMQILPQNFMNPNQAQSSLHGILDVIDSPPPTNCDSNASLSQASTGPATSMLTLWAERYQRFIDSLDSRDLSLPIQRRITLLELHHTTAELLHDMKSAENEMVYDLRLRTFQNIVQQCERVLRIEGQITAASKPTMAVCFDLGIIMPLHLTATRCRHPGIRRKAMRLLTNFPRREGIWLSWVGGMVAQLVIDIEEDGLHNPQSCKDVPLENRIELLQMCHRPCSRENITGQNDHAPVLQLTWISATAFQRPSWLPEDIKHKTIQLSETGDDRPGPQPYWIVIPRDGHLNSPKLLLGKKTFVPPPRLVPQSGYETCHVTDSISHPTPVTPKRSHTSEGSPSSIDMMIQNWMAIWEHRTTARLVRNSGYRR